MRKIKSYFHFYLGKFFIPFAFSLFILISFKTFFFMFLSLTLSSLVLWFIHHYINDRKKQTLYFYFNQGISELKLYLFTFILNLAVLIILINLLK